MKVINKRGKSLDTRLHVGGGGAKEMRSTLLQVLRFLPINGDRMGLGITDNGHWTAGESVYTIEFRFGRQSGRYTAHRLCGVE